MGVAAVLSILLRVKSFVVGLLSSMMETRTGVAILAALVAFNFGVYHERKSWKAKEATAAAISEAVAEVSREVARAANRAISRQERDRAEVVKGIQNDQARKPDAACGIRTDRLRSIR